MSSPGKPLCPPRFHDDALMHCGRTVLERDPRTNKEDRCPGGLFVCADCVDDFCDFLEGAYNARARDKEWEAN
jgi:hypothetical protein